MASVKANQTFCGWVLGHDFQIVRLDPRGQWCEMECPRCDKHVRRRVTEALEEQFR